jgi:hypothetical protein
MLGGRFGRTGGGEECFDVRRSDGSVGQDPRSDSLAAGVSQLWAASRWRIYVSDVSLI